MTVKPSRRTVPRRRPVQERSQVTVRRILDSAEQLLAVRPVAEITSHRIAEAAGVTIGALYRFFPDRDGVLDEVMLQRIRQFDALLAAWLREVGPRTVREILDGVMDIAVGHMERYPAFRALWFAGYQGPRAVAENRRGVSAVARVLTEYVVRALGFEDTSELRLKVVVGVEAGNALVDLAFRRGGAEGDAILAQAKDMLSRPFADPAVPPSQ